MRLNPNISDFDREWVVNGVRGFFTSYDVMFTKKDLTDSIESITVVFSLFVTIIGAIALFIMFFLLLISMT